MTRFAWFGRKRAASRARGEPIPETATTVGCKWTPDSLTLTGVGLLRITAYPINGGQARNYSWRTEGGKIVVGIPGRTRREPAG